MAKSIGETTNEVMAETAQLYNNALKEIQKEYKELSEQLDKELKNVT